MCCGVVANTTTNQQTQAFFQAQFEELSENFRVSVARAKKKVINILTNFMEDNQCLLIMEKLLIIKSIMRKL